MNKQIIKTNIKFHLNERGTLQGYVTKNEKHSWRGCRETEEVKKKIVFVDEFCKDVKPNMLYHCTLIPMKSGTGFIVIEAKLMQFEAKIESIAANDTYKVVVRYGNRTITYNPASPNKKHNDMQGIADLLRHSDDLKYANAIAEEFIDSACLVLSVYKSDKR